jgi:hypothetical protein
MAEDIQGIGLRRSTRAKAQPQPQYANTYMMDDIRNYGLEDDDIHDQANLKHTIDDGDFKDGEFEDHDADDHIMEDYDGEQEMINKKTDLAQAATKEGFTQGCTPEKPAKRLKISGSNDSKQLTYSHTAQSQSKLTLK